MRLLALIATSVVVLSGCGGDDGTRDATPVGPRDSAAAALRIDRCVDRLLSGSALRDADVGPARRYTETTYCAPFEKYGWIYEDGALNIASQRWLDSGYECGAGSNTEPFHTVPCEPARRDAVSGTIDCALLHHVRRAQMTAYVEELQRESPVRCDDGTPLDELGVP
jgi:hypothetical protein